MKKSEPLRRNTNTVSSDEMLMYCGNQERNMTSAGTIADEIDLVWNARTGVLRTVRPEDVYYWQGTGWTGQTLVKDGRTYWSGLDGAYYCLDAATGKEIWNFKTGGSIKCTACLYRNTIIVGSRDKKLYCLDASDGRLMWKQDVFDKDPSGLVVDDVYYVATETGTLAALKPDTGEILWTLALRGRAESSPSVSGDRIYINCESGSKKNGFLQCFSLSNRRLLWEFDCQNGSVSTAVHLEGRLYFGTKAVTDRERTRSLFCLDGLTGAIVWQTRLPRGIWATPVLKNGKIFVGCDDSYFYCLDRETGRILWKFKTGAGIWATCTVAGDRVVFGSQDAKIYCLRTANGRKVWSIDTREPVFSTPTVVRGRLYIGSRSGNLFCFSGKVTP